MISLQKVKKSLVDGIDDQSHKLFSYDLQFVLLGWVLTFLSLACESTTASNASLNVEFGTCLGQIDNQESCSARIFNPLEKGEIGCWALSRSGVSTLTSGDTFRAQMSWDGQILRLTDPLALSRFPFSNGDRVDMRMVLFDSVATAGLCQDIPLEPPCDQVTGCIAKLTRRNTPLIFGEPISFKDEIGQCSVDTPDMIVTEICDGVIDDDCDGIIDEECLAPMTCSIGEIRICDTVCGEGQQTCVDGSFSACSAPRPSTEICTREGAPQDDEDCDGTIDEGCTTCVDGETRSCANRCGVEGIERCEQGAFQECDAPSLSPELCDGMNDDDCDGNIDEGCTECNEGETRPCESICALGTEICVEGRFDNCDARMPTEEICANDLDDDCDEGFDEACPCVSTAERCDGTDNDCDGLIDEGTRAGEYCLAALTNCAGQVPGELLCNEMGNTRCEPNLGSFVVGEEVCDGVDNDCDGLIDEVATLGQSCLGEVADCSYSRSTCNFMTLGTVEELGCYSEGIPLEECNLRDDDCDGQTDEGLDQAEECIADCSRAGTLRCLNGVVSCEPTEDLPPEICDDSIDNNCNGEIDEGCPVCEAEETLCDGLDNNCNGEIDEDGVCGSLIYQHCEVMFGWWHNNDSADVLISPVAPWTQWPPLQGENAYCPLVDDLNEQRYSCDVARAGSQFQMINIGQNYIGVNHWLGLAWTCSPTPDLLPIETNVLAWAQQNCHVALGYKDIGQANDLNSLSPQNCLSHSPTPSDSEARCIQTRIADAYSAIELEGRVNSDDLFGLAFYCESVESPQGFTGTGLGSQIQDEFQVFLGLRQENSRLDDQAQSIDNLPTDNVDNNGRERGVGTKPDGTWNAFSVNRNLNNDHQFGILTKVR